jgi:hypothetical protein
LKKYLAENLNSPPSWVLQVQVHRSQSRTRILCTNFLLANSLALDWHPIFNAAPGRAEKLLRIRKDWTANPPARPDNQGANPMLSNDNSLVDIAEEMN